MNNKDSVNHIVEHMPEGVVCFKRLIRGDGNQNDYIITELNRSFEAIAGIKRHKLLGKSLGELSKNGLISGFTFGDMLRQAGPSDDNMHFEQFSPREGKWYSIITYKSQENHICFVFRDITDSRERTDKFNLLYESAVRFHEISYREINYQEIATELRVLAGAAFVIVNVFNKEESVTVTQGFSGSGRKVEQAYSILGYNLIGKKWKVDEHEQAVMRSKKLVRMESVREYCRNWVSPVVMGVAEKVFNLGYAYGIGFTHNNEILGSFIIFMNKGAAIKSPDIIELYVNHLAMMLMRKKAEDEVKKIDNEYRTMLNGTQDAMFWINISDDDKPFHYHMVNKGYANELKVPEETFRGKSPQELYGAKYGTRIEDHYRDCIKARKPIWYEEEIPLLGVRKHWHTLLSPVIKDGRVVRLIGSSRDITRLKQWEFELYRERELFKVTIHSIGDAVITTDTDNRIVILNKVAEALTGWQQDEARGKLLDEVMFTCDCDSCHNHVYDKIGDRPDENGHKGYEALVSRDGSRKIIQSSRSFIRDEGANTLGEVIVFRDVTLQRQKEEEIRYLGYHDQLTGLYNRTYTEERLKHLDKQEYLPLGFIIGDCNGLKMANDVFGHAAGDMLLKKVAGIFNEVCCEDGIVARVGGDEFVALLPCVTQDRLNSIMSEIKHRCLEEDGLITPSIALGAAIKDNIDVDIKKIYKLAEDRMYNNKLAESKSIRSSIITSLKKTLEERTHETEAHATRLKELSAKVGSLMGLYDNEMDELLLLAVLHDIGKIAIPDYILGKKDNLTDEEWKIMQSHCEIGYRIAVASPELASIAGLILSHHERWDGSGYPQGLKGDEIPLLSRIIAIVDAYDAMTNDRPYHRAISHNEALAELIRCRGKQFDPYIVDKVIEVLVETM